MKGKNAMKKFIKFTLIMACIAIFFTGCSSLDSEKQALEQSCEALRAELESLNEQKAEIKNQIVTAKEENGTAKYVVTFRIKQEHFTLDLSEHLKDSMNEITIEIPVDKEYYDSVSIGTTIDESFRAGSLIMHGSWGNWDISVAGKEIR